MWCSPFSHREFRSVVQSTAGDGAGALAVSPWGPPKDRGGRRLGAEIGMGFKGLAGLGRLGGLWGGGRRPHRGVAEQGSPQAPGPPAAGPSSTTYRNRKRCSPDSSRKGSSCTGAPSVVRGTSHCGISGGGGPPVTCWPNISRRLPRRQRPRSRRTGGVNGRLSGARVRSHGGFRRVSLWDSQAACPIYLQDFATYTC